MSLFINYVPVGLLHETSINKDYGSYYRMAIPYAKSPTGYAYINITPAQIHECTTKDKTVLPDRKNILLGNPDSVRTFFVPNRDEITFSVHMITNQKISEIFETERKEYAEKHPKTS